MKINFHYNYRNEGNDFQYVLRYVKLLSPDHGLGPQVRLLSVNSVW